MDFDENYKDKVCLVTGANSGIGYALSEELLKRGAIVYMAGRNKERIEEATSKLSEYEDKVHAVIMDVSIEEDVKKGIEHVAEESGKLDFLFNNAGMSVTQPFRTISLKDWKNTVEANLWGVVYGIYYTMPIMLKQGSGYIINTSSISGLIPSPYQAPYALTKSGIIGLTESLRYEFADDNINFATVCPGNIATPIFQKTIDGVIHDELPIPDNAFPVDETARYILDQISKKEAIIIVPEDYKEVYHDYLEDKDDLIVGLAKERKEVFNELIKQGYLKYV